MRTSKIAALVAATALLVVGSAIAAFAATNGWVEEAGTWKYYKNGEAQSEIFAKSGDNWYWLDENGEMATDTLVSYNDYIYYVDENGCMVKNTWKELPNTDDDDMGDTVFYYFQNTGKAYKSNGTLTWKTINGKKYTFNENGKMLYGWIDANGEMVDDTDNNAYQNGLYYCGEANDGARRTSAWQKYYCVDLGNDIDGDKYFYFGANGQKVRTSKAKTINGKKYAFSDDGIMLAEWVNTTSPASTATGTSAPYAWFQDAETGAKYANGWFKVVPQASMNATDNNNEDEHWYYADAKGVLAQSTIKSIKGKQYAFNAAGELQTGLQWVVENAGVFTFQSIDDGTSGSILIDDVIDPTDNTYEANGKTGLHFFSDDADNDGAMKTGTVKTTANGDEYSFKLGTKGTSKGVGYTGKDGSYIYKNGYKFVADSDVKTQVIKHVTLNGSVYAITKPMNIMTAWNTDQANIADYYVISTSGAIVKSGTKTDADGYKVKVTNSVITGIWNTNLDKTAQGYVVY